MKLNGVIVLVALLAHQVVGLQLKNEDLTLQLDFSNDGPISVTLTLGDVEKLSGAIGYRTNGIPQPPGTCEGTDSCLIEGDDALLNITAVDGGFIIEWESQNLESQFQDCIDLKIGEINWYGGSGKYWPEYPIENLVEDNKLYIVSRFDYSAISERYWLNSVGGYIFMNQKVPLYLDQNTLRSGEICFIASVTGPYVGRNRVSLEYVLAAAKDPRESQIHAVLNYLGMPSGPPDERVIRRPIFTTWAQYKTDINDKNVVDYAIDIAEHGFVGQLEIDDFWETCYGSLVFNTTTFPDINNTVRALHEIGFTVTLWTHPFVNHDCTGPMEYGEENNLFVRTADGNDVIPWWNGDQAHHLDFTKENATEWFVSRLKRLQELHNIDSFKFDAGETDWAPQVSVLNADPEYTPNALTAAYVTNASQFGGLIEVRTGWRTQNLPVLVRVMDKDTKWGLDNGLHALIVEVLQQNLVGYTLVLPDMIGGNQYGDDRPTAELIARWMQANVFLPTMQFSLLPWEISAPGIDGFALMQKFVGLHQEYADLILEAITNCTTFGTPVNGPIWFVDPTNPDALKSNDQFLLGERIVVAPVIVEGATSRDIVIPTGSWEDANTGEIIAGPTILRDYPAPIDVLPYFIRT